MNTITPLSKMLNSTDHRWYFGTYLNMARHNAYMILKFVGEKYDLDDLHLDEDKLSQAKAVVYLQNKKNQKPDIVFSIIKDLRHYFPFLNYQEVLNEQIRQENLKNKKSGNTDVVTGTIKELQPNDYGELLGAFLQILNPLRNFHSHKIIEPKWDFSKSSEFFNIYDAGLFRLIDKSKQTKRYDNFSEADIEPYKRTPEQLQPSKYHTIFQKIQLMKNRWRFSFVYF